MTEKPRWQYRFDNYRRAFYLLRNAIELKHSRKLSDLEEEGIIQRFEYTWELAWKTIKDYLENQGVVLAKNTPKAIILAAIEAKLITQHEHWMQALDDRNRMSHVYNHAIFAAVIDNIDQHYLALFDQLNETLMNESLQDL